MKKFYTNIIEIETITTELDKLNLSDEEKLHLANLIDSSLHHIILDAILSELSEEDKKLFLKHVHENDHVQIWQFLNDKIDNIENKIKQAADGLVSELHEDIKKVKKGSQ